MHKAHFLHFLGFHCTRGCFAQDDSKTPTVVWNMVGDMKKSAHRNCDEIRIGDYKNINTENAEETRDFLRAYKLSSVSVSCLLPTRCKHVFVISLSDPHTYMHVMQENLCLEVMSSQNSCFTNV